ncbi:CarD family transcriptional regulator [Neobacillus notoginsengisoli]|uniref:CarD family transcriptional regulator n=1 Tax=Neobacillus notoginsengisoli TaxID=1578198 RepID=A0A417YKX2_9BACI|nr:CarD family transcriptional regulator [Neobacillus notoginsengisoli]RHW33938.1 CarD family transcriptional regulator [Neobacillus notoginsengisoli]
MFNIGDLVIYSGHGICKIDDISDKTVLGMTRSYYVLYPIENKNQLTISTPVQSDNPAMLELVGKEEAVELLASFKDKGIKWINSHHSRRRRYENLINGADRQEVADIVNTLIRKKIELKRDDKQLYKQDRKLLDYAKSVLFKELAISLDTSVEKINKRIVNKIKKAS